MHSSDAFHHTLDGIDMSYIMERNDFYITLSIFM